MIRRVMREDRLEKPFTHYVSRIKKIVYMLKGWAQLDFEDIGEIRVEAGDAWYQPP